MMEFLNRLFHALFPLTQRGLNEFVAYVGPVPFYFVIFAIIFCETGLVVTPFLPGDSLLFALGAIGAHEDAAFSLVGMTALAIVAAILGDALNYWIGYTLGPKVFSRENSKLLNKKHLLRAQEFYEKYGAKTIILARFVPIVRTFAPFVAGVGRMSYPKFFFYNVVGGIAWVLICVGAGWLLGSIEFVQKRFEVVVIIIILISVLPMAWELWRARSQAKRDATMMAGDGRH